MPEQSKFIIPPHVLAEPNPVRALRLLLDVPAYRAEVARRFGLPANQGEVDEESFERAARYCEEPMMPEEMRQSADTFERIVDDFVLGQDAVQVK